MQSGDVVVHIARTPEEIWSRLVDLESAHEWVPDLVSARRLTDGEVGVGARYAEVVAIGGKHTDAELEITEFEPPHTFAHAGRGGPARFTASFRLEPDGSGGTSVTHAWTLELEGMMKMMEPMVRGLVQKNAAAAADGLRELLESTKS